MKDKNIETVEIILPYFKQGDDLAGFLENYNNIPEALTAHANALEIAAQQLKDIRDTIKDNEVEIDAQTHHISITCSKELAEKLINKELGEKIDNEFYDEEDNYDDNEIL